MSESQTIQWFPGHMAKAFRMIESELGNVDVVIELLDARAPLSSKNAELEKICSRKPHLLLLNKSDLADSRVTGEWVTYYKSLGQSAIPVNSKHRNLKSVTASAVNDVLRDLIDSRARRGIKSAVIRAMVVGIPNVGKSTFINGIAEKPLARTADEPGVTRGKQWINAGTFDLLDMPGVLWPKLNQETAHNLAFTGAVNDKIMDLTLLAVNLLGIIKGPYRAPLSERYKIEYSEDIGDYELLELIAKKRGMLRGGGNADIDRAAIMLLDEFRAGKLGKISLERPEETTV